MLNHFSIINVILSTNYIGYIHIYPVALAIRTYSYIYIMFGSGVLDKRKQDIQDTIIAERWTFQDIYELVEAYTKQHDYSIYGHLAISLTLDKPVTPGCFTYYIYSVNGYGTMINLCNHLYLNSNRIVRGDTIIYGKEFHIKVDFRIVAVITSIKPIKSGTNIINPMVKHTQQITSYLDKELNIVDPEILLTNVCSVLYSFSHGSDWAEYIDLEYQLYLKYADMYPIQDIKQDANRSKLEFINSLMTEFIMNNKDIILLGEFALNLIDISDTASYKLEILSTLTDEVLLEMLSKVIERDDIQYKVVDMFVINDDKLKRTEFKLKDFTFLYKYNSLSYEVVNYGQIYDDAGNFFNIGNIYCIFKFILVNIWIVYWLYSSGITEKRYYQYRTSYLRNILIKSHRVMYVNGKLSSIFTSPSSSMYLFNVDNYMGIYVDEARQIKIEQSKKIAYPYYPELFKLKNGSLLAL